MSDKKRPAASEFSPELLQVYDQYAHGQINRREFLSRAARYAAAGVTALSILQTMSPNYSWAQQVKPDDSRLKTEYLEYDSPDGHGKMRGYMARLAASDEKRPAVLVVHENRGLNPYIEDVVRRLAVAGFLAFGPDALTPLGGYPGNDDEGREMQRQLDRDKILEDMIAAAKLLDTHPMSTGKVGVTGFCFGGWVSNMLAVRLPDVIDAAVPFYGSMPEADEAANIKAPLLLHFGELDERVNAGWPAWEEALKAKNIVYTAHMYEGGNHGFHNDTTPRYDEKLAKLAEERTIAFFQQHLL